MPSQKILWRHKWWANRCHYPLSCHFKGKWVVSQKVLIDSATLCSRCILPPWWESPKSLCCLLSPAKLFWGFKGPSSPQSICLLSPLKERYPRESQGASPLVRKPRFPTEPDPFPRVWLSKKSREITLHFVPHHQRWDKGRCVFCPIERNSPAATHQGTVDLLCLATTISSLCVRCSSGNDKAHWQTPIQLQASLTYVKIGMYSAE